MRIPKLRAVAVAFLLASLQACAPGPVEQANRLAENSLPAAYDFAVAWEAKSTSPEERCGAALLAGAYAMRMDQYERARQHLRTATSTEPGNPAIVQISAWGMLGTIDHFDALDRRIAATKAGKAEPPAEVSALLASADSNLAKAIEIAERSGDKDEAAHWAAQRKAWGLWGKAPASEAPAARSPASSR